MYHSDNWYRQSISFIAEIHKLGLFIRMASFIDSQMTYNINLGGTYTKNEYTESQIRRILKLKAFL